MCFLCLAKKLAGYISWSAKQTPDKMFSFKDADPACISRAWLLQRKRVPQTRPQCRGAPCIVPLWLFLETIHDHFPHSGSCFCFRNTLWVQPLSERRHLRQHWKQSFESDKRKRRGWWLQVRLFVQLHRDLVWKWWVEAWFEGFAKLLLFFIAPWFLGNFLEEQSNVSAQFDFREVSLIAMEVACISSCVSLHEHVVCLRVLPHCHNQVCEVWVLPWLDRNLLFGTKWVHVLKMTKCTRHLKCCVLHRVSVCW